MLKIVPIVIPMELIITSGRPNVNTDIIVSFKVHLDINLYALGSENECNFDENDERKEEDECDEEPGQHMIEEQDETRDETDDNDEDDYCNTVQKQQYNPHLRDDNE
ncbi:unnamed protein product, partial [Rotaria sordida]